MYAVGELILRAMQSQGISKAELAIKLGYKNTAKGIRRINHAIEKSRLTALLYEKFPSALGISRSELNDAIDETERKMNEERIQEARRREEQERAEFTPHIFIKHERTTPSPIFVVAIVGEAYFKRVSLPSHFRELTSDAQISAVEEIVVNHYREFEGSSPSPYGKITGYYFRTTFDSSLEFSTDGKLLGFGPTRFWRSVGALTLKGRPLPFKLHSN